ncbi:hypothetical protein [Pantoea cypripedii]|uniref:Uncharacterized protein n=1 Tax=Pantoea cypripedii TaxID=55209 RepID=A0A6B9GF17_PANCY|nr:hypothetical protein [Pantoea cypripedii]QGY32199.1 hypothetical protein CUN67_24715 [Pantoea cypripedii]
MLIGNIKRYSVASYEIVWKGWMQLYARLTADVFFPYHYSLLSAVILILRERVTIRVNILPDENTCRVTFDIPDPDESGDECLTLLQWLVQETEGQFIIEEEDAG